MLAPTRDCTTGVLLATPSAFDVRPFEAARCRIMQMDAASGPKPWLSPLGAAVYEDPKLLEGGQVDYAGSALCGSRATDMSS